MGYVFVMSHASDIDGVGSAALVKRKYALGQDRMFFADYSKESLEYVDSRLEKHYGKGMTLFVADLGVNEGLVGTYKKILAKVASGGGKTYWFDHHPWDAKAIKELVPLCEVAIVGENRLFCATEITRRELGLSDPFSKKFASIVHYSDFNLTPKSSSMKRLIGHYALSITSYSTSHSRTYLTSRLRHMADVISAGKLEDRRVELDAERFRKTNEERVRRMVKDLYVRKDVAVGFSKHVQSTYGCGAVIDASGKKIGIYVNVASGKGHIRSTGPDISGLASSLGGGGHPRAAGFNINSVKFGKFRTQKDRNRFADFMQESVEKLGVK